MWISSVRVAFMMCCSLFMLWGMPRHVSTASAQFGPPPINDCNEYLPRTFSQLDVACLNPRATGRWSPRRSDHERWCRTASPQARANEVEARRNDLVAGCRSADRAQRRLVTGILDCVNDSSGAPSYVWRTMTLIQLAAQLGQIYPSCRFSGRGGTPTFVRTLISAFTP